MPIIVIWFNPNKWEYYYKIVKGYYRRYEVGMKNRYGHSVILVIKLRYETFHKMPLRKKVLTKTISFLQRIEKKI